MFSVRSASPWRRGALLDRLTTPNVFTYSRRGTIPHLTAEVLPQFPDLQAVQITVPDLLALVPVLEKYPGTGKEFLDLDAFLTYTSLRDPIRGGVVGSNSDEFLYVDTLPGRRQLSWDKYMALQRLLKPNIFASMAEDVPIDAGKKRCKRSVTNALSWLDRSLAAMKGAEAEQWSDVHVVASIAGGIDVEMRAFAAREAAKRDVDGFAIGGLFLGESFEQRRTILGTVLPLLPPNKPRILCGAASPVDILDGVELGVDLFESAYPHQLASAGRALVCVNDPLLTVTEPNGAERSPLTADADTLEPLTLDLTDKRYELDPNPLLADCACYSCKNHTRAYIYHLLNAEEMTGEVLLTLHNTHHFFQFLTTLRAKMDASLFTTFKDAFMRECVAKTTLVPLSKVRPAGDVDDTEESKGMPKKKTKKPRLDAVTPDAEKVISVNDKHEGIANS
eukprot:GILJ01002414.1.p1 GENE.GILJ01002414.1~~GILJ01002414.1.p1  ORF type:complete len:449 (+),score=70.60 GILJ01002414.1:44-1390(+)